MKKTTEKKTPKPRRRLKVTGLIFVTFMITFVAFLVSSIFLKSLNVTLDISRQDYEYQIASVRQSNELLQLEVRDLSNYDRVMGKLDSDMHANDNVIFTVNE